MPSTHIYTRSIYQKNNLEEDEVEAFIRSSYNWLILPYCKALLILAFITWKCIILPNWGVREVRSLTHIIISTKVIVLQPDNIRVKLLDCQPSISNSRNGYWRNKIIAHGNENNTTTSKCKAGWMDNSWRNNRENIVARENTMIKKLTHIFL